MNKKLQLVAIILIISATSFAQVGIGTTTPAVSAALDKDFRTPDLRFAAAFFFLTGTLVVFLAISKSCYFVSLCSVWLRQNLQYFLSSSFCGVLRLFLVVL